MATLEKIRNKSVLLFIIIIVALLAFILGDFLTSGRTYFGDPTSVAKAGGVKVEYQDYQQALTQAGEQMRNQGREVSNDVLSQSTIQNLLAQKLMEKEYQELGITVTDKEITEALTGDMPHPAASQMIYYLSQQLNLPEASGRTLFDAMQNPAKYNIQPATAEELKKIWANQEKQIEEMMLQQKFMALVSGLYTYNKLDAKNFYDDLATTRHLAYVSKDASSISDDEIELTDADVQAVWNSQKQNYRLDEPTREINYIYVAIEPSQSDRAEAQKAVENAIEGLRTTPGTEAIANDSRFVAQTVKVPMSAVTDSKLRTFLSENESGAATVLSRQNDTYTLAKLIDVTEGIDSINISVLQAVPGTNLDSLLAIINNGSTFESLSDGVTTSGRDSLWTALEGLNMDAKVKSALENNSVGKAFILTDTVAGGETAGAIYRINRRHAPVKYYDVATIEFTVDPSQETLADLATNLRTFLSSNSSAKEFVDNANNAGYSVLSDQVTASSTGIGNARESRKFVKWAMEAKKGQVSPMMQDDRQSYLIAVAVSDIYDDYLPWSSPAINTSLRAQARNNKKAEKLMAEYYGKATDLQGYAQAMGTEVNHGSVNFTSPTLLNVGVNENALHGAVAAAPQGKLVGPLKGNRGILVFTVEEVNSENRPFVEADYGMRFNQTYGLTRQNSPLPLLLGKNKIDNRSLKFVAGVND